MSKLYEIHKVGDRRTVVRFFKKGTRVEMGPEGGRFLEFKFDAYAKVTQEYKRRGWEVISVDYETAVEAAKPTLWQQLVGSFKHRFPAFGED